MNFGQNLYNWFLSNAQSLVLMAIVVIGIYLGFKRESLFPPKIFPTLKSLSRAVTLTTLKMF